MLQTRQKEGVALSVSFPFPPGLVRVGQDRFPRAGFPNFSAGGHVDKLKAQALQVAKEIMVKFIEGGRISPANFSDYFKPIYAEVLRTISEPAPGETARGEHEAKEQRKS